MTPNRPQNNILNGMQNRIQNNMPNDTRFPRYSSDGFYGLGNIGRISAGDDEVRLFQIPAVPDISDDVKLRNSERGRQAVQTADYSDLTREDKYFSDFYNNKESLLSQNNQSFMRALEMHKGEFAECDFLVGNEMLTKCGILYDAGNSYIVLFDENLGKYTVCDESSLKFATFYNSKPTPQDLEK